MKTGPVEPWIRHTGPRHECGDSVVVHWRHRAPRGGYLYLPFSGIRRVETFRVSTYEIIGRVWFLGEEGMAELNCRFSLAKTLTDALNKVLDARCAVEGPAWVCTILDPTRPALQYGRRR